MQWLVGHAQLLITIMEQPDRIRYLADRIVDYNVKTVQQLSTLGLDAILFQDDWGTQRQLMIRPERWRELFKPYYRRMFSCVREHGMQVHFHTDGYTLDIIPDLIEVGADVLNPQFSVMDLDALARAAAGKVCIRTDIDRQYVLTRATPEEVREYMRRALELFSSPRGGYIAYGEINSDASLENVEAMYEALEEFGRYEPADEDSTEESGSG